MANNQQYGPYTARPGKTGPPWLLYLSVLAAGLAFILGVWYVAAPESLARAYGRFLGPELQIQSLALNVDRRLMELAPGGAVEIHPRQSFSVQGLATNRWRNYDLRLYSPDFDIAGITGGAASAPLALMGEDAVENGATLRIEVKEGTEVKAVFIVTSRYTAADLAALGDGAAEVARKAHYYQKALKLDPTSRPVREKLIAALIEGGEKARAAEIYEDDLQSGGPAAEILNSLLSLYEDMGDGDKTAQTLTRLIDLAEKEGREADGYRLRLAAHHRRAGRGDLAAAIYEGMVNQAETADRKADLLAELRAVYHDEKRADREIETIKRLMDVSSPARAAGLWAEVIALYETLGDEAGQRDSWLALAAVLPDGPNKANAYKRAAHLLAEAQMYTEAAEALKAAAALVPADAGLTLNLARLALATGDRAAYRAHLEETLRLDETRLEVRRELAGAYFDDGLYGPAERQYDALLAQNPADQASRLRLIGLLEKVGGREDRLKNEYARLSADQPDDKVAAYNLGVLYFREGLWDEAEPAFKRALALDPADLYAREYLINIYDKKGRTDEMLAQALELYRLAPDRADLRELIINTCENAGNLVKLADAAEAFATASPTAENYRFLAQTQGRLARPIEAATSLFKAAEAAQTNEAFWFEAAEALSVQDRLAEARLAYEKILELSPQNNRAAEALLEISLREVKAGRGSQ